MMNKKRWAASLTVASLVAGLAPVAGAATQTQVDVGTRMNLLGVVQGSGILPNGQPDLNLDGQITRAELVTTIVRSFGLEASAQMSKDLASFVDVPGGQWYSGYVAVANNLARSKGIAIGRSETIFDPNASVTKAEALVFVLKFLGLSTAEVGEPWYNPWFNLAASQGVLTPSQQTEALQNAGLPATRGEAFLVLDYGYRAKVLPGSQSLYTQFVDSVAPTLTLVNPPTTVTQESITLSGMASDNKGVASVKVNGNPVLLTGGSFSTSIRLNPGANTILVEVTDLAGNTQLQSLSVLRASAQAASIQASDLTVGAGQSIGVGAVVQDAGGNPIPGAVLTGTSTVGSFANGQFTAGSTLGSGKLILQSGSVTKEINTHVVAGPVAKVLPASVGPGGSVKLQATDAYGHPITSGLTWSLGPGQVGAVVAPDGTFHGMSSGNYLVIAASNGSSIMGQVGVYGMATSLRVEAPARLVGNGKTEYTVKVFATDNNGFVNTGFESPVRLRTPFGNQLSATAQAGVATFTITASDLYVGEQVTLEATATGGTGQLEGSTKAEVVAQQATSLKVEPATDFLTSNATSNRLDVAIQVLDQEGAPMLEGDFDLTVAVTGPAVLENGAASMRLDWNPFLDGVRIQPLDVGVNGTVTVTASGAGLPAAQAQVAARMAGTARQIMLKANGNKMAVQQGTNLANALYFQASLGDSAGVPVTPQDRDLKLVFTGIANDDRNQHLIAFDLNGNGTLDGGEFFEPLDLASLTQTDVPNGRLAFWLISRKAGSFGVQVVDAGSGLTASPTLSYEVTAGLPHHFVGLHSSSLLVQRGLPTVLKYQLVDSQGNPVKQANLKLLFAATGSSGLKLNGQSTAVEVLTDADGIASVMLVAESTATSGQPISINTSGTNTANGWSSTAITWDTYVSAMVIAPGAVETAVEVDNGSGWVPLSGALTAGATIRLVATVKDTQGYPLPGVGSTVPAQLVAKSNGTTQTNLASVSFSDPDNDGIYHSTPIVITKVGTQTLTAELSNLSQSVKVTGRSVNVRAAEMAGVKIGEATNSGLVKLKSDHAKELTIQLTDAWGNPVTGAGVPYAVRFRFSATGGSGYTSFRDQNGIELIPGGVTIGAGRTGARFFLMTNQLSGNTIMITAEVDVDGSGTFSGPAYYATYTLSAE